MGISWSRPSSEQDQQDDNCNQGNGSGSSAVPPDLADLRTRHDRNQAAFQGHFGSNAYPHVLSPEQAAALLTSPLPPTDFNMSSHSPVDLTGASVTPAASFDATGAPTEALMTALYQRAASGNDPTARAAVMASLGQGSGTKPAPQSIVGDVGLAPFAAGPSPALQVPPRLSGTRRPRHVAFAQDVDSDYESDEEVVLPVAVAPVQEVAKAASRRFGWGKSIWDMRFGSSKCPKSFGHPWKVEHEEIYGFFVTVLVFTSGGNPGSEKKLYTFYSIWADTRIRMIQFLAFFRMLKGPDCQVTPDLLSDVFQNFMNTTYRQKGWARQGLSPPSYNPPKKVAPVSTPPLPATWADLFSRSFKK